MIKHFFIFGLVFSCAITAMQKPTGTPAQQATAQFTARIDQEFKPELVAILREYRPFNLLNKLKNFYNQNQSMFPSMREMCASFMLTLKYPMAALGSKISGLEQSPTQVELAWKKEWVLASLECNLEASEQKLLALQQKVAQLKNKCASIVDQQAFYPCEENLKKRAILLAKAKKIVAAHDQLQSLQEKPLTLFKDIKFQQTYNESLRELYSPQLIDADAQEMHPDGHSLLFQLCHQNLSVRDFSQMLTFLTSGQQGLGINTKVGNQTLLDYAKQIKLDQEYITTIRNLKGKPAQEKVLSWSGDIPEHKYENDNTLL